MNKRIEISVNQEDVQNIIDCYEKDIEYIKQLEEKVNQLETSIATKDSELLQLKEELRQLKTNRDEAIEILKLCNSQCSKEAISKLERGKE